MHRREKTAAEEEKEKTSKLPKLTSWLIPDSTSFTYLVSSDLTSTSMSASNSTVPADNPIATASDLNAEVIPQEKSPESLIVKGVFNQRHRSRTMEH